MRGPAPCEGPHGAAPSEPVFRIEQCALGYGQRPVLRDVSFEIWPGQFWCFLGSNGAGKTTLIRALLGAIVPRAGRIVRRADLATRHRIGYVPQALEASGGLPTTVDELVTGGLAGLSGDSTLRRTRLRQVLEHVGLVRFAGADLASLSGGQRQRAMVARALIRDPRVLIVDEPLAGLDMPAAQAALALMDRLHKRHGIAVLFVTHDIQLAADRATHVALFRDGRVMAGPASEMLSGDELAQTFQVPIAVQRRADGGLHIGLQPRAESGSP